ncbi:hypothetical protein F4802DRAFT_140420 [Xylaria palmicola]|nr:hypothetical protein F4802DRAFT_140420 [Xylaria palmicola]
MPSPVRPCKPRNMRLACVDGEEVIELQAALDTNPSLVRGLLSTAFFAPEYPDMIGCLMAERFIRKALNEFAGEHERRVSTYLLTRSLDQRINPVRVQLIEQAFADGGPVALAGVFYATIDSHRNIQNRETLNYLISIDEPTRANLFRRAESFPSNPTIGPWLVRLLDKLEIDSRDLAGLLLCLGCVVPTTLFDRARLPSRTWGEDGEVTNTPSDVTMVIRDPDRFDAAIQHLSYVGFALTKDGNISVSSSFRAFSGTWGQSLRCKEEALRLVSHSFPKHKVHYAEEYTSLCYKLLSVLRHVIQYLPMIMTSRTNMYQITETCLSASRFLDEAWKREIIIISQHAAERSNSPLLLTKVLLRRLAIERMYGGYRELFSRNILLPGTDVALICYRAQEYIDRGLLSSAHGELSRFKIPDPMSSLERMQQQEIFYMKAKVYRFEGQFTAAKPLLVHLINNHSHLAAQAIAHLSAVQCELGQTEQAITTIKACLQQIIHDITRSRLELALADARLMQSLRQVQEQRLSWFFDPSLHDAYTRCLASLPARAPGISRVLGQISITAAFAILAHLRGDFDTALTEWNRTLDLAQGRGLLGSYIELLVARSTIDLQVRRGGGGIKGLQDKVRVLSARTGRQYHFLGLGTAWPDILTGWQEVRDRGYHGSE